MSSSLAPGAGGGAKPPYSLVHGASWLLPDGGVLVVPGFHEEWIAAHEDLAEGARNVCELILRKRWISAALFGEGYLELMVPDRRSDDIRRSIWELLSRNAGSWAKVLVMSMDEEGYAMLEPADLADADAMAEALMSNA